jgi:LytS/YehU family sensor histidine kinase
MTAKIAAAERDASEARLKLLETQLEPHMLFNTLANLRVLIGSDPARAQHMLDHLIDYLRATLNASRQTSHTLHTEFARLEDYLALMAIRMGPRLAYALDLPPTLAQAPVPTLLLQPLVENSIRHGLEPQVEGGRIEVGARQQGGSLVLTVRDTGAGLDPAQAPGFGLTQVRERLVTAYGPGATLRARAPEGGGTLITLTLPLP